MIAVQRWLGPGFGFAMGMILASCASAPAPSAPAPAPTPAPTSQQAPAQQTPTSPPVVKEADEQMIAGCQFLGSVVGKSGWGGLAAGAARNGAMRSAKKKAAKLGATHIVFGDFDNGSGVTMQASTIQGRAYRCPPKES